RCPVILGSATPSLESIQNLARRDYREIRLPRRVAEAVMPEVRLIDMKTSTLDGVLSQTLHGHIAETLKKHQQVLVFQNRRGYAPAVMCHDCGWLAVCTRCDKPMTLHKQKQRLWCHHCDRQITLPESCPECSHLQLVEIGHGTERIEESLQASYPGAKIVRIDRDTTRRKGSMDTMVGEILDGDADILIGTQMLAKGHHFPDVTLAVIVDIDGSLYSTDFRAIERMGQLITQVSGRAGRGQHPGTVLIQTHFPDHPLIRTLLDDGYMAFSTALLEEREAAGLPPFSYMAVLRAEANSKDDVSSFLVNARAQAGDTAKSLQIIGPVHAPMQRRAGRYRMQLVVQSTSRQTLNRFLGQWLDRVEDLKQSRKVRWSIDVDPQDMM
ncbi:MAG: primosomal protein N', partial [Gammaproteobacteria bacterium]|nr:primosomal protein N' [Gammaproteobacteria bacterium]